jgi:hypothetical protein
VGLPVWALELHLCAFPALPTAWEDLQDLDNLTALLLPTRRARLLPPHLPHLATLTQLRGLQLGVTVPSCSESEPARQALASLTALTRLTHLGFHGSGCSAQALTKALCGLTGLVDLQLEGSVYVDVSRLASRLHRLKALRLQQELTFDELTALTGQCRGLTRLHCAGVWQTMSAAAAVEPLQLLEPNDHIPPYPGPNAGAAGGGGAGGGAAAGAAAGAQQAASAAGSSEEGDEDEDGVWGGAAGTHHHPGGGGGLHLLQRPHPLLPLPPPAAPSHRGLRDAITLSLHTCMVARAHLAPGPLMVLQLSRAGFEAASVEAFSLVQLMEGVVSKSGEYAGDEVLVLDSEYVAGEGGRGVWGCGGVCVGVCVGGGVCGRWGPQGRGEGGG